MCEKRIRKIKRGSQLTRFREARRMQRLQWMASPPPPATATAPVLAPAPAPAPAPVDVPRPPPPQPNVDVAAKNRVIIELALKTIVLMQKNRLIQQKIIALQRETSEFVAAIMRHPENRRRYLEHVRLYGAGLITLVPTPADREKPLKVEPET